jgi:tagaturonate epimerase
MQMFIDILRENNIEAKIITQSTVTLNRISFSMANTPNGIRLFVLGEQDDFRLKSFEGNQFQNGKNKLIICPLNSENAAALRFLIPWLKPIPLGLKTSVGMGDRLGLATPGHIHAIRKMEGKIAPIFAQQSIRENTRTGRSPQEVIDDATWGVFLESWRGGYGSDADHLKTTEDIDLCLQAGYTFFTIDPGAYVDNRVETSDLIQLKELANELPSELSINQSGLLDQSISVEHLQITLDELTLLKAMVKYGKAIWHVHTMYEHLKNKAGANPFELEVSVDETDNPTSHAEHIYIVSELKRLNVKWISLAPRFVGDFEKGVDYIGDLEELEEDIKGHAAIARTYGPYKISLHSGSDKFSIYKIAAKATKGMVHLKTAGTSYLEALRTIAELDSTFFQKIYEFCLNRYDTDKVSYHVSAQLCRAPIPSNVENWTELLDNFDAREILHVTFGSVLQKKTIEGDSVFFDHLLNLLKKNPELYAQNLEKHFLRHLIPFVED